METEKMEKMVKFSFPKITTHLNKDGIEKKKMHSIDWGDITKTQINKSHDAIAVICGKISGITVFDFDDREEYEKLEKQHPELKNCYTVLTNKGCHKYFNYDENIVATTNGMVIKKHVDIRNNKSIAFCPPTTYKSLAGKTIKYIEVKGIFMDVPDYLFSDLDERAKGKKQN